MIVMEEQKSKSICLSSTFKKKIYNEFNTMLYREFNQTISDINYFFGYKEDHLYYILDEAFEAGGPSEMRSEIDYLIKFLRLLFNKVKNNNLYDEYDLIYHYTKKYFKPRIRRKKIFDKAQLKLQF
jgi:hypothetical protein